MPSLCPCCCSSAAAVTVPPLSSVLASALRLVPLTAPSLVVRDAVRDSLAEAESRRTAAETLYTEVPRPLAVVLVWSLVPPVPPPPSSTPPDAAVAAVAVVPEAASDSSSLACSPTVVPLRGLTFTQR